MSSPQIISRSFGSIAAGVALGLAILLPMRVAFYEQSDFTPNMAPQIAYLFSPVLFVALLAIAFVAERVSKRWLPQPRSRTEAFIIGFAYVTLLLFWAFPGYGWVMIVVNPITVRWLAALAFSRGNHVA